MTSALRVLVLCTGNRWRSPLLAHCLRGIRPSWDVRSAGTRCGHPGADVPGRWRTAVVGWGGRHVATKVTAADVRWADVIVCVQRSHVVAVRQLAAVARRLVLHRLPDPAFHRVSEWPALAQAVVAAAPAIVAEIEAGDV